MKGRFKNRFENISEKIAEEFQVEIDEIIENEYHRPASMQSSGYQFIKSCVEEEFGLCSLCTIYSSGGNRCPSF